MHWYLYIHLTIAFINTFKFMSHLLNQIFLQFEFFHQVRFFVCWKSSVKGLTVLKALEELTRIDHWK